MSRPGSVFIENFDRGIVTTMGGVIVDVSEDGKTLQQYAVTIAGVVGPPSFGGRVPIVFKIGTGPFNPKYAPAIEVSRTGLPKAFENGGQSWGIKYTAAAEGSALVSVEMLDGSFVEGATHREIQERAIPHNIEYDVQFRCRGPSATRDSLRILRHLMRAFPAPGGTLSVLDSEGETRGYDVLQDSLSPNTEVLDLSMRDIGWTISLIVHGEMDISDYYVERALTSLPVTTVSREGA